MASRKAMIGVVGGREADQATLDMAYEVGRHVALNDAHLVTGGMGGVMEAASRGAAEHGGTVVAILPGGRKEDANKYAHIVIPTALDISRNVLVVRTADVLIAFPGSYGTLSEMALALNLDKTVIGMPGSWDIRKAGNVSSHIYKQAFDPAHAIGLALDALR